MNVKLIAHTPDPDFLCGRAAAICTGGNLGDVVGCMRALKGAMASGHLSVVEHACFTFLVEGMSRVTLAQETRHRVASFSVESQRYCGANLDTVMPDSMARMALVDDIAALEKAAAALYEKATALGVPAEDARYYTLQGGKCRQIVTMNARELLHFFELRSCNRAQWEIRDLSDKILELCREVAPVIFAKAGPGCVRGKCPEGKRACGHPRT